MAPRTKPGATNARATKTSDSPAAKPQEQAAQAQAQPAQVKPANDPTPANANTVGKVVPKTSWWEKALEKVDQLMEYGEIGALNDLQQDLQNKIDARVEASGYSTFGMVLGAGATALNQVLLPTNVVDLVPGGKGASATRKAAKATSGARDAGKAADARKAADAPTEVKPANGSGGGYSKGTRRRPKNKCELMPYKDMICDGEKHHVVPDWTLRTGSATAKKDAATRIPGTPAYEDGLAICISKEEHKGIHKSVDRQIEAASTGGTVPMGKAKEISGKEAAKRSGCNPKSIKKQLDRKIKTPDDALVRGVKDARKVTDEMKSQYGNGQGGADK